MLQVSENPELPVARRITEAVHQAVRNGDLAPGDKLPARLALARQLKVNATTVGHTYERLETQGVVVSKRGSGTYVAPNPLRRLETTSDSPFTCIAYVIGASDLTGCTRDELQVAVDIQRGLEQMLGTGVTPIRYVESFNRTCLDQLPDHSAVLSLRPVETEQALVEALSQRGIPTLGVWGFVNTLTVPQIDYDRHQAARLACEHLIDCGYRQIGYVGQMGDDLGIKFFQFTNVLFNHNLDYEVQHVREVHSAQPGAAYSAVAQMVRQSDLPEAFFVDTDYKAMEVLTALHDAGLRVPEDVGLIGYDDIPAASRWARPPLTTVRTPRYEIGRRAAQALLAWVEHGTPLQPVSLPAELIVRGTTRAPGSVTAREHQPTEPA